MRSRARGKRAGFEEPIVRGKGGNLITSTDFANTEGDVLQTLRAFRAAVWGYWKKNGRHDLAWRKTKDPYKIFVSEVMLQQTQVPRVKEKYTEFLEEFPTVEILARTTLANALRVWSGMGYNRRAKYLRDAAKVIVEKYGGKVPKDFAALRALPGIGPYTASAVRVFAFNQPDILIETNIRATYIHHYFARAVNSTIGRFTEQIHDKELIPIAERAAKRQDPRSWNWALMDYGTHIKKLHKNPARRSAHYVRQSKFEGSLREIRGAILKTFAQNQEINDIRCRYKNEQFEKALEGLVRNGLIENKKGRWTIA